LEDKLNVRNEINNLELLNERSNQMSKIKSKEFDTETFNSTYSELFKQNNNYNSNNKFKNNKITKSTQAHEDQLMNTGKSIDSNRQAKCKIV